MLSDGKMVCPEEQSQVKVVIQNVNAVKNKLPIEASPIPFTQNKSPAGIKSHMYTENS